MKTNSNKPKAYLHGECIIKQSRIPKNAAKENLSQKDQVSGFTIIADSETTGNHHVVDLQDGIEFYNLDGVRYMRNSVPAKVRCVLADRHSTVELPAGEYQFGYSQEFDYFEMAKRNVRD